jgi:hypothetical protein
MSKSILDNLFGSRVRVKLLKLLYRQHPNTFAMSDLTVRVQEPSFIIRRELDVLRQIGMIKKHRAAKTGQDRYGLDTEFGFYSELRDVLLKPSTYENEQLVRRINGLGRVKLAILAGVFVSKPDDLTYESPADLFIVGDDIERGKLTKFLKSLEAEMGTEIRYGVMEKDEFKDRYKLFDRFIRIIIDGPHKTIINKIDIDEKL